MLSKAKPNQIGLLKKPDGNFTNSETETLELLASTHFPGSHMTLASKSFRALRRPCNEDWCRATKIIRPNLVQWTVDCFKPYKTSGDDGIMPIHLLIGIDILFPYLVKIFSVSFVWGYIPELWTIVKVLFIPKAGRKDYALPKSFRPLAFLPFFLRHWKNVIDRYIRDPALATKLIHYNQHAYRRDKSTKTALISVIDSVEKALEDKEIAVCAFPDVEGAFDSSPTSLLVGGLTSKNVDPKW
ncbi:unnamed protein product [Parnassius mnemosyne]|uniref:Reverse transcriptase domain-containing protein n=1 Tax=Parnassius mnemosyne TaxID=213953 RepID=A0AAV1L174_9NEOP